MVIRVVMVVIVRWLNGYKYQISGCMLPTTVTVTVTANFDKSLFTARVPLRGGFCRLLSECRLPNLRGLHQLVF